MNHRPIEEILSDALERDPSEWSRFLESACGGDGRLRAEVESLLSFERSYPEHLKLPTREEESIPDRLSDYRVVGQLARGGMGIVLEGVDDRLKRRIAIKLLPDQFARDPQWRSRFEREAQLLAAMSHPNVATIHSLEEEDGRYFLTMELLEGWTLADRLTDRSMPRNEALEICRQVSRALQAVHEKGIVHCDLKPRNVAISPEGTVKVIDFGLARPGRSRGARGGPEQIDEGLGEADRSAGIGASVTGTPGYMSPEQVRGERVDHRTDIWAFGCILYECLTGRPAFAGQTALERMKVTLEGEPDWNLLPRQTSDRIRSILRSCLEKESGARLGRIEIARRELDQEIAFRSRPEAVDFKPDAIDGNLPLPLDDFIGRVEEREMIRRSLEQHRLVTLVGTGGCGKTRLAIECARLLVDRFEDGVWFVDLGAVTAPEEVVPAVLSALDVAEDPSCAPIDRLIGVLEKKNLLILLDNCEHLLDPCSSLAERIATATHAVSILATSREEFHSAEETAVTIPPLPIPDRRTEADPEALAAIDSVRLFLSRARAVQPDFTVTAENAPHVGEICRRLDGIPLALELAAARMESRSAALVVDLLEKQTDLITADATVPRHQALESLIDWSYALLDPKGQLLFRRLSAFAGGWTLDDAEEVCSWEGIESWEMLELLSTLLDKHLIEIDERRTRTSGKVRYRFLETMKRFAVDRLRESSEETATSRRHVDWAVALAENAAGRLEGPEQGRWLVLLDSERDNLRRALQVTLQADGQPEASIRLAHALERYWLIRGHWREGRRLSHEALKVGAAEVPGDRRAHLLLSAGSWDLRMGDPEGALRCYEEALSVSKGIGEQGLIARSIHNIGGVALHRGDLGVARSRFEEYLAIETDLGNRRAVGVANNSLGLVAEREGDFPRARALYGQSLAIWCELGDRHLIGVLSNNVGAMALTLGDLTDARACFNEAIETQRKLDHRADLANSLYHLGLVEQTEGNLSGAARSLAESIEIHKELEDLFGISRGLIIFAELAFAADRPRDTAHLHAAAEALRERIGRSIPPEERRMLAPTIEKVRAHFGEIEFDRLWAEGRSMSVDRAIEIALAKS